MQDPGRLLAPYLHAGMTVLSSRQISLSLKPGTSSSGMGEHVQGRSLTPDEVMRLGPTRPIVMISGEPPYILGRINYLTDTAYAGRFEPDAHGDRRRMKVAGRVPAEPGPTPALCRVVSVA